MSRHNVNTKLTSAKVREIISSLPDAIKNQYSSEAILIQIGIAMLGKISQSFVVKSNGGTDEAGERWAPLSPKTVAYSRRLGRNKRESNRNERPSQGLTKKQQDRWWDLYRQGLGIYKGNKSSAARRAWFIIKKEGATTLIAKYGNQKAPILNNTGQLLDSLTPGSQSKYQVLRVEHGNIVFGTNRPGAATHHNGSPSRNIPQRRLWPPVNKWPDSWWKEITKQVQEALVKLIIEKIK